MGMAKIPVGKTIGYAYGFTFGNFLTLLGLGWLALFILAAGQYLIMAPYITAFINVLRPRDAASFAAAAPLVLIYYIAMFALFAMINVAFLRQALGMNAGRALYYFSLGRPVWRALGAYALIFLIYVAVIVGFALATTIFGIGAALIAGGTASRGAAVVVGLISIVLMLVMLCAIVFILLRFGFLLTTIVVAEERISLGRSWRLTGGNVWRMFAILLTVYLPLFFVYFVVLIYFVGINFVPPNHPGVTPEELAAWDQQMMSSILSSRVLPAFHFLFSIIFLGLTSAASAFAYRALVPPAEGIAAEFA
jgi:hypothetical protein